MSERDNFEAAATTFTDVVGLLAPERYDAHGLGAWDLRSLVGHTTRALVTVVTYVDQAEQQPSAGATAHHDSPEAYLAAIAPMLADPSHAASVEERGRAAGVALGSDPHATVLSHLAAARAAVDSHPDGIVVPTVAGSMRLVDYLPTRTFELVVHTLDIAHAQGLAVTIPQGALHEALGLCARAAVNAGRGQDLLRALTGRHGLAAGFSVV